MWTYRAKLRRVIDADTLELAIDCGFYIWTHVRVRVVGVNAPERNTPAGRAAMDFAEDLLGEGVMTVRTDLARSFERWLAEVALPDGTDYAARLIEAGHGERYVK